MSDKTSDKTRRHEDTPRTLENMTRIRRAFGPAPPPPGDFVDRVMRNVTVAKPPRRGFLWWLWRPVEVRFSFRPAAALACAVVIAAAVGGAVRLSAMRGRPAPSFTRFESVPQQNERSVTVRFAIHSPEAREVQLAGDWNGWKPESLRRGPDGTWTLTRPLPTGDWRYSFVVDGAWVDDPLAEAHRPDGFGGTNAVLRL